jgi:hypothetical protein
MEVDMLKELTTEVVARVLDWKQKGGLHTGVPRNVGMRGGLSGRITKERKAEQSFETKDRTREEKVALSYLRDVPRRQQILRVYPIGCHQLYTGPCTSKRANLANQRAEIWV